MLVDLHTHSNASDGVLAPEQLLARAEKNGVELLALTDHDTMHGVQALQQGLASGTLKVSLQLVPGAEITSLCGGRCVHIVGLWLDAGSSELQGLLAGQRQVREERAERIAHKLAGQGVEHAYQGALQHAGSAAVSRPHFARYLVEQGHCATEQQAFKRWLGKGKVADVACAWPQLERVVSVIQAAGGLAVLAHPLKYGLTRTRLTDLLAQFAAAGGEAVELVSGAQPQAATRDLLQLCQRQGLACSSGSDFHSPAQTWCDIGRQPALPEAATAVWELR
ncbi:MAG: PHP domain-containing protein [Gammaproteobacteria bacterium]|nr:PHP domain-containing protein [Gammaproteobacteria bacterium]